MSQHTTQLKHLARSPKAMMDFQMRGKLPNAVRPDSPLIRYLESISPRERINITNIRLSPSLGYQSGAQFSNAQVMLNYLKPSAWVVGNYPAESYRIKAFSKQITKDLFQAAQR